MMHSVEDQTHVRPMSEPAPAQGQMSPLNLLWGHRWLAMLGAAVGVSAGWFYYQKQPPVYSSKTQIQIVEPYARNLPIQGMDGVANAARSLSDEVIVMRSEKVLTDAVKLAELDKKDVGFNGLAPEDIALRLGSSKTLKIAFGGGGKSESTVIDIEWQAGNPEVTQGFVQGIVDSYSKHLKSKHQDVGKETLDLIKTAQTEVLAKLEVLEDEYDDFRKQSQLIFRDGQSRSVHRDNADKFLSEKQRLIVEQTKFASSLESARIAINANEPMESVLLALQGGLTEAYSELSNNYSRDELSRLKELGVASRSQLMKEKELYPLQVQEHDLIESLGSSHPAVKSIQNRIEMTQNTIAEVEAGEREAEVLRDAVITEGRSQVVSTTPEEDFKNRVRLKIMAMKQQLAATEQELTTIAKAYDEEMEAARSEGTAEMEFARFEREIGRQQALYDRIVARLDEMNIMANAEGLRAVPISTPKPGELIGPSLVISLASGGVVGLLIAMGIAFLIEVSDKSYHSAEQIAEHLRLPVIGHVPNVLPAKRKKGEALSDVDPTICTFYSPRSRDSEAFKAIRTALYFSNQGGNRKVLQVTSAVPAEGKSTVAANCAVAIAQSGKSVLIVDCDLRRPKVHKLFGLSSDKGLAWLLDSIPRSGTKQSVHDMLGEVVVESDVPNLSVIPSGIRPENPSELLSSNKFDLFLEAVRDKFDVIILDSPPMLAVTDPSNIASRADGVILVVRIRKNIKPLAAQAVRMLETLDARIIGVVVNGVGSRAAKGYGKYSGSEGYYNRGKYYQYGYGYSYGNSNSSGNTYGEYYEDDKVKGLEKSKV